MWKILVLLICFHLIQISTKNPDLLKRNSNRVMPWMCLEKCGSNSTDIKTQLKTIAQHQKQLTGVSFECYELGPDSIFKFENLTNVGSFLKEIGLETFPMISSCIMYSNGSGCYYPDQFLSWLRQLFANPQPFIQSAVNEIMNTGYSGYNVDFEPTEDATEEDAINFAEFLTTFAVSLHKVDKLLTVDIASWNLFWNWTLISNSEVDRIFLMNTYTGNFTWFKYYFERAVSEISISKLGIGFESINPDTNQPFSNDELQQRFELLTCNGNIEEIDIWDIPIPDNFYPFIDEFIDDEDE